MQAIQRFALAAFLLILLCAHTLEAQPIPNVSFELVDVPELEELAISVIFQDRNGFIWIGSQTGLFRYDGYELFRASDLDPEASGLAGGFITIIQEDLAGTIWASTSQGMSYWSQSERKFIALPALNDFKIFDIVQTSNSVYWMSTNDGLLKYIHASDSLRLIPYPPGDGGNVTTDMTSNIYVDGAGRLWFGIDSGVFRFDPNLESYTYFPVIFDDRRASKVLTIDGNQDAGLVVVGTYGGGVYVKAAEDAAFQHSTVAANAFSAANTFVNTVRFDDGHFWVASNNGGILALDAYMQRVLHRIGDELIPDKDPPPVISAFFRDSEHRSWIGTYSGLFFQKTGNQLLPLNKMANGSLFQFDTHGSKSTLIDRDGFLWVGTMHRYLKRFDTNSGNELFSIDTGNGFVHSLAEDQQGNIWAATSTGLKKIIADEQRVEIFQLPDPPFKNSVDLIMPHVYIDSHERVWISTARHGPWLIEPGSDALSRPTFLPPDSELASAYVYFIYEDRQGVFWIGTEGRGLFRHNPAEGGIEVFRHTSGDSTSISDNRSISIAETDDAVWIGTRAGLNRFDRTSGTFRWYTIEEGLPNNEISCILPENQSTLWLATRNGMARLDSSTGKILRYNENDGLPDLAVPFNSCTQDATGSMYIGNHTGLFRFHPTELPTETTAPAVNFTGYDVGNERFFLPPNPSGLDFDFSQNYLTFYFSMVDYLGLKSSKYEYRLNKNELPASWISANRRNFATYSELGHGKYSLEVRGTNHRGLKSAVASLDFTIHPPFWRTTLFYVVATTLLLGLVISLYQWRVQSLLRVQQLRQDFEMMKQRAEHEAERARFEAERAELEAERTRTQIAKDLHDDLGGDASRLVMSLEGMLQSPDLKKNLRDHVNKWFENAREVANHIRDLSWLLDSGRDALQDLVDRLHHEAHSALDEDILTFKILNRVPDIKLDSATRRDLFLIFREALTNIQRHAQASQVNITVSYENDVFGYDIVDNGVGCDLNDSSGGNGRQNMRMRAERIGAELNLISSAKQGMSISLRYKMA